MPKNYLIFLIIGGLLLFFWYNQQTSNAKLEQEVTLKKQENDQQNTKYCLDKIEPELKQEENKYKVSRDRGCFLEAGGMPGVTDSNYEVKFDEYNDSYYKECLGNVYKEIENQRAGLKKDMMDECLKDFQQ